MRLAALGYGNAPSTQNLQSGWGGNGESSVGTIDPTAPFNDRAGEKARLAQHFQSDAGADDIDDGINRADFVKMDLLRWLAMNFPFCHRDPLEDRHGLLLDPIGKRAAADQFFDLRESPPMRVLFMSVAVLVLVNVRMSRLMSM